MKFEQLKNSLKEQIMPIYLLEGEEGFFRDRGEELIKSAAVSELQLNFASYDGAFVKQNPDQLVNLLASCPFMSDRRAITVTEWYPNAQDLKDKSLKEYFENPFDTSVLIIVNSKKSDQLKKIKTVTFVDCQKGSEELISKYIRSKTTKEGLIISASVIKLITEYCLYDMTRIDGEVDKLIAYKHGDVEITEDDVNLMVTKSNDYKIYEMVSYIASKQFDAAYRIIEELNSLADRQMLLVSLYYHFRRMFFVSMSNGSDREIAEILGVKEFAVTMARRQAKSFSAKRLKKIMDKLAFCDGGFKSGIITFDSAFLTGIFTVLCE